MLCSFALIANTSALVIARTIDVYDASMNKQKLLAEIISKLEAEFSTATHASKVAHEAATHEESKPEDQYDTRGLEASYLAEAQSARAGELQKMIKILKEFSPPNFAKSDAIQPGALIELLQDEKPFWVFFLPCGAGIMASQANQKISVVTTSSPFGNEIRGKKIGDQFEFSAKGTPREYEVVSIY